MKSLTAMTVNMNGEKLMSIKQPKVFIEIDDTGDFTTVCDSCGCPEFTLDMNNELACVQCEETIGFAERKREE